MGGVIRGWGVGQARITEVEPWSGDRFARPPGCALASISAVSTWRPWTVLVRFHRTAPAGDRRCTENMSPGLQMMSLSDAILYAGKLGNSGTGADGRSLAIRSHGSCSLRTVRPIVSPGVSISRTSKSASAPGAGERINCRSGHVAGVTDARVMLIGGSGRTVPVNRFLAVVGEHVQPLAIDHDITLARRRDRHHRLVLTVADACLAEGLRIDLIRAPDLHLTVRFPGRKFSVVQPVRCRDVDRTR